MSRSRRKTLVLATHTAPKQKSWKQQINRIFRRKSRINLSTSIDSTGEVLKDYFFRDINKRKLTDVVDLSEDKHLVHMLSYDEWSLLRKEDKVNKKYGVNVSRYDTRYKPNHANYDEYVSAFKSQIISK